MVSGMLDGVRVVDFSQVVAGPACTRLMAEMGAEVVKIELAPAGDHSRFLPAIRDGRSAYFCQHNQGKKGVCMDLRDPRALAAAKALLRRADVMVENFAPGAIDRLGLGWETVHALNPDLIMCSISAFGQDGPLRELPGFDYIAQAVAGVTGMIGDPDGPPALTGLAIGDIGTAIAALSAINAALFRRERRRDGGRRIDVSILDFYFHGHEISVQMASLGAWAPRRSGSHHGAVAPLGLFPTRTGHVYIVVLQPMWGRLCAAIGRPELADDPRFADNAARVANRAELTAIVEAWTMAQPDRDTALRRLEAERVPAAAVLSVEEAMAHPHLVGRGTVREVFDPAVGRFKIPGNPLRFSGADLPAPGRAPFLGEHNREVLRELAGVSDDEIAAMERDGALRAEPLPAGA